MRSVLLAVLSLWLMSAAGQSSGPRTQEERKPETVPRAEREPEKKDDSRAEEKAKPRPPVILKKNGNVGDDAAGGRGGGASSTGGTPGTPSGSFTR